MCHNEQSGFAEDWLHLGRAQARWATPKPLRLGHAQAREWLGMELDLLGALALHSVCTVFASLLWFHRKQAAPRPKAVQVEGREKFVLAMLRRSLRPLESKLKPILVRLSVCTVFRDSNSVTNSRASRTQNQTEFELC